MPAETSLAICSLVFSGMFDSIPGLRVLFAHGGGSFPGTIGARSGARSAAAPLSPLTGPRGALCRPD